MRRAAFTLLEMILVLALLVIVAALATPSLVSMQPYYRNQGGADALKSAFANARAAAMDTGQPYRVAIVPGKSNFRVAPDDPTYWTGSSQPFNSEESTTITIIESAAPKGVVLSLDDSTGVVMSEDDEDTVLSAESIGPDQWRTLAVLLPDGSAREDARVILRTRGTYPLLVYLRSLTGIATAHPLAQEDR